MTLRALRIVTVEIGIWEDHPLHAQPDAFFRSDLASHYGPVPGVVNSGCSVSAKTSSNRYYEDIQQAIEAPKPEPTFSSDDGRSVQVAGLPNTEFGRCPNCLKPLRGPDADHVSRASGRFFCKKQR